MTWIDEKTDYSWTERVERVGPSIQASLPEKIWKHPFPIGSSYWFLEGFQGGRKELSILLNLLAEQWIRAGGVNLAKNRGRRFLKGQCSATSVNPSWIAVSRASRNLHSRLPEMSLSSRPLLLLGENGSGKKYLAELLHNNGLNPSDPFTGPESTENTGTLFVPDWQLINEANRRKLLADKRRVIAAAVPGKETESLRELWYKRTGDQRSIIKVPALREHSEDIPMLAGRFIEKSIRNSSLPSPAISPTALKALIAYIWPGNIRELKETMAWSLEKFDGIRIRLGDLPPAVRGAVGLARNSSCPEQVAALEYEVIKEELFRQRGNLSRTARALGLSPRQVSCRIKKYGINPREFKLHH